MVKFIGLYKQPEDKATFDRHMTETHLPLCQKVPNLLKLEVTRISGTPRGPSEFYMMVEMYFADQQTMMDAFATEAGMATGKDARNFEKGLFTGMFADAEERDAKVGV